ncbi:TetR family transcriptional regulator [Haloactinopolyspora alba]|uniref:TetR family transcriptional regulator n=1 Tax=Haloactinopolyspora alba TaxID=648780 RepID=A0A2P8EBT1_9ACTN|nr:TetR/AcrR family transcriptional regulator [Haloactinopolyspora alba]PSL06922.1 TetR family transcriptional regulator [Haloactinopolyspora alba]
MTATAEQTRPRLRVDATRNRERIIATARDAFVEQGPDVPLDTVAQRAGVGNATLYRHFVDRAELIHQVTIDSMARVTAAAETALAEEPDAFDALQRFVHHAADERVGALCSLLGTGFDKTAPDVVEARTRLDGAINRVLEAAHRSGRLRPDVGFGDLMLAITQLTRPVPGTACVDIDRYVHRHLQLFLDGLRTPARSTLTGSAANIEDLEHREA